MKNKICVSLILFFLAGIMIPLAAFSEEAMLVPVGRTVGITVNLNGVSIVNTAEFEDAEGRIVSPAKEAGLSSGDIIIDIDGRKISSADDIGITAENSGGREMELTIQRKDKTMDITVIPKQDKTDRKYKLGVWIKEAASGIGTLTFYDPKTKEFGALGHGICDAENNLISIKSGVLHCAEIASVNRGEKGKPGELIGIFTDESPQLGRVDFNGSSGIGGVLTDVDKAGASTPIPIAAREEVSEGEAKILSNIEGETVSEYSIKIIKINEDELATKGMIVKITDERLLEKTGGIVRGMSGSPIIKDGKLVGAVTHVFVNDPSKGYGIFIDNMLAEAEKLSN